MMTDFTSIRQSVDNIRSSVINLECTATTDYCNDVYSELDSIESELDQFEPDEEDEFTTLIPTGLSAGDADSLKELILNWRKERGYGTPS